MIIPINNKILDDFKMINQEYLVDNRFYDLKSGVHEYRLYSYLSTFFNDTIILDIGTKNGRSALALSHNNKNHVISYDIVNRINNRKHKIYTKKNLEFRVKDVLLDLNEDIVKKIKIVMIDIDHYETIERMIIDRLNELNFSGIILLDDTTNHPEKDINIAMNRLWNNIEFKKYDVTKYGHWSGTGIVILNSDIDFEFS